MYFSGFEPKQESESRVRRNDLYYCVMTISILLHLALHLKIKYYKIKLEKKLLKSNNIFANQKKAFVLKIDKTSASNFATSFIVFCTFILSNQVVNYINVIPASELKEYPHYLSVYWYYFALFSINSLSIIIWYFARVKKLLREYFERIKKYSSYFRFLMNQSGNSQNFLRKFLIFFVTFRCFYKAIIRRRSVINVFTVANINFY